MRTTRSYKVEILTSSAYFVVVLFGFLLSIIHAVLVVASSAAQECCGPSPSSSATFPSTETGAALCSCLAQILFNSSQPSWLAPRPTAATGLLGPPRSTTTVPAPLLALRSRCFPLLLRNFSLISHFSLAFLARVSLFRFSQLSALRRTLSTGNLCRIRTLSGVHRTLEESSRDLSHFKFKYGAVVLFVPWAAQLAVQGKAVAKLLFKPLGFVMKMSHRELQGKDLTDCSTLLASSIGAKVVPRPASMLAGQTIQVGDLMRSFRQNSLFPQFGIH